METLKEIGQWLLLILFGLLMVGGLWIAVAGVGTGKYRISQGTGSHESAYRTDEYKVLRDGCVVFKCAGDSMRMCGTYRIR